MHPCKDVDYRKSKVSPKNQILEKAQFSFVVWPYKHFFLEPEFIIRAIILKL